MGNIKNTKIIKIYGVTMPRFENEIRPYGHGRMKVPGTDEWFEYVDYFIDDLVALIKKQGLEKEIIEKLTKQEKLL